MPDDHDRMLNVRETAERLGVHENTVRNWAKRGELPDARIPGSRYLRFRESDVKRLVSQRGATVPTLQHERRIINPELISASQLNQWPAARARDAQERLPELVRRLLVETPGVTDVSIRTGDGIAFEGYDGQAMSLGSAFLPKGHIVFEFGTDKKIKAKADHDFESRAAEGKSNSVFVFVTPRRWPGADQWEKTRRASKVFRNVKVIDADILEGWLKAAPGAHHWISEHLGLSPRHAQSIDAWWDNFSRSTDPELPAKLFTAGRDEESKKLLERLKGPAQLTTIKSEWMQDCLAFVYTSLLSDVKKSVPSALIVSDPDVWARVIEQPGQAVLVPLFEAANISRALENGHHVLSLIDRTSEARRAPDLVLPRLGRKQATEALSESSLEFNRASRLAALGRRSLPALVRQISVNPRISRPEWAKPPASLLLAPLALVGAWTSSPEDWQAIEGFTGSSRPEVERTAKSASHSYDPALRVVAGNWVFASPDEAFLFLKDSLTASSVAVWVRQAVDCLLSPDPLSELSAADRIGAELRGVRHSYSATLRRGVAHGLALLGADGADTTLDDGSSLPDVARNTVESLLRAANDDTTDRTWRRLTLVLPLLAEAAPDAFLRAVEENLAAKTPTLLGLFEERADELQLGPSSEHHHLLWALETICWSAQHLIDGVRCLTNLAALDPGGRTSNRPASSLSTVLCGWVRNTTAPMERRLRALDVVYKTDSRVGWKLMFDLWPSNHGFMMSPSSPRVRDEWLPDTTIVLMSEWIQFTHALVERALQHAGDDPARLSDLVAGLPRVSPADKSLILDYLGTAANGLAEASRLEVWEKVHTLVARHERFDTADWAVSQDILAQLQQLASTLEPLNDPLRFTYLFSWHPDLSGVDQTDFHAYDSRLREERTRAITEILGSDDGMSQLMRLATRCETPGHLGWALAERDDVRVADMLPWVASPDRSLREAGASYARRSMLLNGQAWLRSALTEASLDGKGRHLVLLNIPADSNFWAVLAEDRHSKDSEYYWTNAPIDLVPLADTATAVDQLTSHKRPLAAVAVISHALDLQERDSPTDSEFPLGRQQIANLLDEVLQETNSDRDMSQMTSYYLGKLLDHLARDNAMLSSVARFEFAFFRVLEHTRQPQALNHALANRPELFVDLAKRVYRAKNEPRKEDTGEDQGLSTQAWWVLREWRGFPGRTHEETLDPVVMNTWVKAARFEFSESDRSDIGDELIGQAFARSPVGADGVWPAEPVRELIEQVGSTEMESGLVIGRLNIRGVTMRGPYDGGAQERELAATYNGWSEATHAEWPRTSRVLRNLARSYERDAQREDSHAELDGDQDY